MRVSDKVTTATVWTDKKPTAMNAMNDLRLPVPTWQKLLTVKVGDSAFIQFPGPSYSLLLLIPTSSWGWWNF